MITVISDYGRVQLEYSQYLNFHYDGINAPTMETFYLNFCRRSYRTDRKLNQ